LVYVLPLLTLMFGAYAGSVRGGDAGAVMGAAVGLLVGALVVGTMARFGTARGWWSFSVAAAPQADDHGLIELPRPGAGR